MTLINVARDVQLATFQGTRHKQSKCYCIAICSLKFILIDAGEDTQVRFRLSLLLTFPNKCYWGLFDASPKSILPAFFIPGTYVKTKRTHSFIILDREFINDNFTKTDSYLKIHFRV